MIFGTFFLFSLFLLCVLCSVLLCGLPVVLFFRGGSEDTETRSVFLPLLVFVRS